MLGAFQGWAPDLVVDVIASFSFLTHFNAITKGVIDVRDLIFFASIIALALFVNTSIVNLRKAA